MSVRFALIKKQLEIPFPIFLAGYFDRDKPATEMHDPLNISCFYVENEEKAVAVFGLDLLGIYGGFYDQIVDAVKDRINNPNLQMVFSSAHTHSAPGFRGFEDDKDKDFNYDILMEDIISKAVSILKEAPTIAKEATLKYAEKPVNDVGANRRDKNVSVNTILKTLAFDFDDKNAIVVNFNCHPTHMSAKNYKVSKDYQGAAMDELAQQGYLPMFLQGACGDISTRFTRVDQTFEDMARIGHIFAEEIKSVGTTKDFTIEDFSYNEYRFEIPKKQYQSEEFYLSEIAKFQKNLEAAKDTMAPADLRILQTALEGIRVEYHFSSKQDEIDTSIRCGILKLNDKFAMVFLPFELFSKLADMIIAGSAFPFTMVVGYSFDGLGYMPDSESFDASGYEILSCTYEKGAGEIVAESVIALLNQ